MNFIGKINEISLGRKSIRTEGFQTPEVVRIRETRVYIVFLSKTLYTDVASVYQPVKLVKNQISKN
jgi:hypothetical protein